MKTNKCIAALCGLLFVSNTLFADKKHDTTKDNQNKSEKQLHQQQREISSENNYNYSITRPSKERFIDIVNRNREKIANSTIEKAYADPMGSPNNALIYAMAMDYTLNDGSEDVLQAYQTAAYAGADFFGHRGYIEYADFMIRTQRYDPLIERFDSNICYQFKSQCAYYIVAAKYLRDGDCDVDNAKEAYKFKLTRSIVTQICPQLFYKK